MYLSEVHFIHVQYKIYICGSIAYIRVQITQNTPNGPYPFPVANSLIPQKKRQGRP